MNEDKTNIFPEDISSFGNAHVDIIGSKLCIAVRSREDLKVMNGTRGAIACISASPETMRLIAETIIYKLREKAEKEATAGKREMSKRRKDIKAGKVK